MRGIVDRVEMLSENNKKVSFPNLPYIVNPFTILLFIHDYSLMFIQTVDDKRTGEDQSMCYKLTKGTWKKHCPTKYLREYASVVLTDKG